jgi:hypothetical protein
MRNAGLFPLGNNGTPTTVERFRERRPELPLLEPGTEFEVTLAQIVRIPNWGDLTEITAKMLSGPLNGQNLGITYISRDLPGAFTGIDTNLVAKVTDSKAKR